MPELPGILSVHPREPFTPTRVWLPGTRELSPARDITCSIYAHCLLAGRRRFIVDNYATVKNPVGKKVWHYTLQ